MISALTIPATLPALVPVPLPEYYPVLVGVSPQGAVAGRDDPVLADQRGPTERLHVAGDGVRGQLGDQLCVSSPHYRNTSTTHLTSQYSSNSA